MIEKNYGGGPAFPHRGLNSDGCTDIIAPGMTLRDWFAGMALMGIGNCSTPSDLPDDSVNIAIAKAAYSVADAMISERNEEKK